LASLGAATVNVTADVDALAAKVGGLIDQVNGVLREIKTQTAYDVDTKKGGILLGDFTVRTLQSNIVNAVTNIVTTSTIGAPSGGGATLHATADGLNAAPSQTNLKAIASVVGGALVVQSAGYGLAEKIEVRSSDVSVGQSQIAALANVFEMHTGTSVAGEI